MENVSHRCSPTSNRKLRWKFVYGNSFLDPEGGSQNTALVLLLLLVISSVASKNP